MKTRKTSRRASRIPPVEFLNPAGFASFEKRFVAGGWDIDPVLDFFECLLLIIDDTSDYTISDHVKSIASAGILKSFDDANRFLSVYTDYYNSVVFLLEYIESSDDRDASIEMSRELAEVFVERYESRHADLAEVLGGTIILMSAVILRHAGIDPNTGDIPPELLKKSLDEDEMKWFSFLMFAHESICEKSPSRNNLVMSIQTIISVAVLLNADRKTAFEAKVEEEERKKKKPKPPRKPSGKKPPGTH